MDKLQELQKIINMYDFDFIEEDKHSRELSETDKKINFNQELKNKIISHNLKHFIFDNFNSDLLEVFKNYVSQIANKKSIYMLKSELQYIFNDIFKIELTEIDLNFYYNNYYIGTFFSTSEENGFYYENKKFHNVEKIHFYNKNIFPVDNIRSILSKYKNDINNINKLQNDIDILKKEVSDKYFFI